MRWLALALGLVGCYDPTLRSCAVTCVRECADGLVCGTDGFCHLQEGEPKCGDEPDGALDGAGDGSPSDGTPDVGDAGDAPGPDVPCGVNGTHCSDDPCMRCLAGTCQPLPVPFGCEATDTYRCEGTESCYVACFELGDSSAALGSFAAGFVCEAWVPGASSDLVVVDDSNENDCVYGKMGPLFASWIGFRQNVGGAEPADGWFPISGGSSFTHWQAGQPNDIGNTGGNADCAQMAGGQLGTWYDDPCAEPHGYTCEIP